MIGELILVKCMHMSCPTSMKCINDCLDLCLLSADMTAQTRCYVPT
jgi:hypothetical protein